MMMSTLVVYYVTPSADILSEHLLLHLGEGFALL